jgi:hypothetical protein
LAEGDDVLKTKDKREKTKGKTTRGHTRQGQKDNDRRLLRCARNDSEVNQVKFKTGNTKWIICSPYTLLKVTERSL